MSDALFYQTIVQPSVAEFKDRGSKFIAYARPLENVDDFKLILKTLKKEHPKAVHHCFAYRLGVDENTFRVSDDGEPAGSAGRPILGQIDSKQLTNVLVVVVRYFGGSLLGVPGLINAYKTATSLALQVTPAIQKQVEVIYLISFEYTLMNDVMRILKSCSSTIHRQENQLFAQIVAGIPKARLEETLYSLAQLPRVETEKYKI